MTNFKSIFSFLVMVLAFGIVVLCGAPSVNAQDKDKGGDTAKTEKDDNKDGDDKGGNPSRAELKTIRVLPQLARKLALARVPGTIVEAEVEKENGRLVYEVDIKTDDGKRFEVEIDALTGEVIEAEESKDGGDKDDK
jgi:uncharacterized membrane protein YkoI